MIVRRSRLSERISNLRSAVRRRDITIIIIIIITSINTTILLY